MQIHLTEAAVRDIKFTTKGQQLYFDTKLSGFGLCVGTRSKTFILQRQIRFKTHRVKIGRYNTYTCAAARLRAKEIAYQIESGDFFTKADVVESLPSLHVLLVQYLKRLRIQKKPDTIEDFERIVHRNFADWLSKPADHVTEAMIAKRHSEIADQRGSHAANKAMRVLRSLFNQATELPSSFVNPVSILTKRKLWFDEAARETRLHEHQIQEWFSHLQSFPNDTMKDAIMFILLNGVRKSEALNLMWSDVDFVNLTFLLRDTKNRRDHKLPITSHTLSILRRLHALKVNDYVFASESSNSGHLINLRKAVDHANQLSNTNITIHDLRRTFTCAANKLNLSGYTIKRLLNHSVKNDVTSVYIPLDTDDLRQPLQSIADKLHSLGVSV